MTSAITVQRLTRRFGEFVAVDDVSFDVKQGEIFVFLDEPTGGVDPVSRRQFWRLIDQLSQAGTTVLVTTHYLDEAEHCHRIAVMNAGKLAALGTTSELKRVFADRPIVEIQAPNAV